MDSSVLEGRKSPLGVNGLILFAECTCLLRGFSFFFMFIIFRIKIPVSKQCGPLSGSGLFA